MMTIMEEMYSIQKNAKIAGILYLLIASFAGFFHFYVPGELFVSGDAGTTASNIMASPGLFRMSIATELVILLSEVVLTVLLYGLLKPVNKTLSLIAAVSRLTMTTIHGVNLLNLFGVLLLLGGAGYLTVFQPDQLNALVRLFLDAYSYGFAIGIIFFTLHVFLVGYLIFKSGYFPKVLGVGSCSELVEADDSRDKIRSNLLMVNRKFMDGYIAGQIFLVNTTKRSQKIA